MDSSTRRFDPQEAETARGHIPTTPRPLPTTPIPWRDPRAVLEPVVRRNSNLVAFGLIALGGLLFFGHSNLAGAFGASIPLVVGLVFLYVYETQNRNIGFFIPGAILTGLGAGGFVAMLLGLSGLIAVGLGLGFLAVAYQHREHWWALIPGGILILAGLASIFSVHAVGWLLPFLLVGGGLWLLARQRTRAIRQ